MNGEIPVFDWYIDGSKPGGVEWEDDIKDHMNRFTPENIRNNWQGGSPYGWEVCLNLLRSFDVIKRLQ